MAESENETVIRCAQIGKTFGDKPRLAMDAARLTGWDHKYADELSGCLQQRAGLARAIAADPTILLTDEPFSARDPLIRKQLQTTFMGCSDELHKNTIFPTHDPDEATRICDRIAIMKDGVPVQIGTPLGILAGKSDRFELVIRPVLAAMRTIPTGLNPTIMLSLSMAVIALMIAVKGLGNEVPRAMGRLDAGKAIAGGLGTAIALVLAVRPVASPITAKLLEPVKIDINDISAQNKLMADGEANSNDIDRHVADWIAAHQAAYDACLEAARAAAN
ncbi:ATP-binding cassette domain-containing protein [Albidovulum sediminicola]|uniref:ATP-binding cassette domain-containing protein n=1 Tax=Albidovulum sediminicola TaxID=2984331 RepID=UPI0039952CEB